MKKKPTIADPFSVWGNPPKGMLHGMSDKQIAALKGYITKVTGDAYRLAHDIGYDNGFVEAMCKVSLLASKEMKDQRDKTFKRTHG